MTDWREEPISRSHDRASFDCGVDELNVFLRRYARQNDERGDTRTFVLVRVDQPRRIIGYYTIAPAEIDFDVLPEHVITGRARYPLPVFRLARLAVDLTLQGRGVGRRLLLLAAHRALDAAVYVGGAGLVIDAIDERAAGWYETFGAHPLLDSPRHLLLSFDALEAVENEDVP